MELRYHRDLETGLPHIYDHGVREEEVAEILRNPAESRKGSQGSIVAVGQGTSGRCLKIIYVPDAVGDGAFVVTAYELQGKPLQAFRRRERRRGK